MSIYELTHPNDIVLYCNTLNAVNYDVQNLILDDLNITSTVNATSTSTGAVIVAGGIAIGKDLFIGGTTNISTLSISSTADSTSTSTGALIVAGGIGTNSIFSGIQSNSFLLTSTATTVLSSSTPCNVVCTGNVIAVDVPVGMVGTQWNIYNIQTTTVAIASTIGNIIIGTGLLTNTMIRLVNAGSASVPLWLWSSSAIFKNNVT